MDIPLTRWKEPEVVIEPINGPPERPSYTSHSVSSGDWFLVHLTGDDGHSEMSPIKQLGQFKTFDAAREFAEREAQRRKLPLRLWIDDDIPELDEDASVH